MEALLRPQAQESHDRIWTSDPNKPWIVVSGCDRKTTSRRSRPLLHAVRRIASKKDRQIAGNLTGRGLSVSPKNVLVLSEVFVWSY